MWFEFVHVPINKTVFIRVANFVTISLKTIERLNNTIEKESVVVKMAWSPRAVSCAPKHPTTFYTKKMFESNIFIFIQRLLQKPVIRT